mmetsp:Transcript_30011/g.99413  ORF Transcript_30011/g.99413 Transcript_30011/m.99413 type:complete len:309 (+) Transcript_30011:108-1034(+)
MPRVGLPPKHWGSPSDVAGELPSLHVLFLSLSLVPQLGLLHFLDFLFLRRLAPVPPNLRGSCGSGASALACGARRGSRRCPWRASPDLLESLRLSCSSCAACTLAYFVEESRPWAAASWSRGSCCRRRASCCCCRNPSLTVPPDRPRCRRVPRWFSCWLTRSASVSLFDSFGLTVPPDWPRTRWLTRWRDSPQPLATSWRDSLKGLVLFVSLVDSYVLPPLAEGNLTEVNPASAAGWSSCRGRPPRRESRRLGCRSLPSTCRRCHPLRISDCSPTTLRRLVDVFATRRCPSTICPGTGLRCSKGSGAR